MNRKVGTEFGSDRHNIKTENVWRENPQNWKALGKGNRRTARTQMRKSVFSSKVSKKHSKLRVNKDIEDILDKKFKKS